MVYKCINIKNNKEIKFNFLSIKQNKQIKNYNKFFIKNNSFLFLF